MRIDVAKVHMTIDSGRAMIYRTRFVKLQSRKKLPMKPTMRETTLSQKHQRGSWKDTASICVPSELDCPSHKHCAALALVTSLIRHSRHSVTSAAMDMTFASGPIVAASRGTAVLANHQSSGSPSSQGRRVNFQCFDPRFGSRETISDGRRCWSLLRADEWRRLYISLSCCHST